MSLQTAEWYMTSHAALADQPAYIRRIRAGWGFTQDDLASLLGVHKMTVSKWERGVVRLNRWGHVPDGQSTGAALHQLDVYADENFPRKERGR